LIAALSFFIVGSSLASATCLTISSCVPHLTSERSPSMNHEFPPPALSRWFLSLPTQRRSPSGARRAGAHQSSNLSGRATTTAQAQGDYRHRCWLWRRGNSQGPAHASKRKVLVAISAALRGAPDSQSGGLRRQSACAPTKTGGPRPSPSYRQATAGYVVSTLSAAASRARVSFQVSRPRRLSGRQSSSQRLARS
jgi:hypothetical protein